MHPIFATQIIAEHQNTLLRQATIERTLREARATRNPPRPHIKWRFQSPLVRRPFPANSAICR
jgi:hypothetical protein